jgi:hypothetical protein
MNLIPVLLALAISGLGIPSKAETRVGVISTPSEPCTQPTTAPSWLNASGIYDAAPELAADALLAAEDGARVAGRTFVTTPNGTTVQIPEGWVGRTADSGKGIVYQRPGATGNADMIRIMDPTKQYPNGYVRYYNQHGQPLDVFGKPGSQATTHIPLDHVGSIKGWPQ